MIRLQCVHKAGKTTFNQAVGPSADECAHLRHLSYSSLEVLWTAWGTHDFRSTTTSVQLGACLCHNLEGHLLQNIKGLTTEKAKGSDRENCKESKLQGIDAWRDVEGMPLYMIHLNSHVDFCHKCVFMLWGRWYTWEDGTYGGRGLDENKKNGHVPIDSQHLRWWVDSKWHT